MTLSAGRPRSCAPKVTDRLNPLTRRVHRPLPVPVHRHVGRGRQLRPEPPRRPGRVRAGARRPHAAAARSDRATASPTRSRNVLANPHVGLLFLVPGVTETFRVNGRASLTTDPELLAPCAVEGKVPKLGILVEIDEAYTQCSKALLRSHLWDPSGS